jgi:hypothetical protein
MEELLMRILTVSSLMMVLAGCTGGDSGDSGKGEGDADTDADADADTDYSVPSISWGGSETVITVSDAGSSGFGLCWAQNGNSDGWYGESCMDDSADGTNVNHTFSSSPGTLTVVASIGEVVAGSSTLFDSSESSEVTYLVYDLSASELDSSNCAWGGYDTSYYAAAGYACAE